MLTRDQYVRGVFLFTCQDVRNLTVTPVYFEGGTIEEPREAEIPWTWVEDRNSSTSNFTTCHTIHFRGFRTLEIENHGTGIITVHYSRETLEWSREQIGFVGILGALSLMAWLCNCISLFKAGDEEEVKEDKTPSQLLSCDPVADGTKILADDEE